MGKKIQAEKNHIHEALILDTHGPDTNVAEAGPSDKRKREQAVLEEIDKRFHDLLEIANDFLWETDMQGRFTYCSPHMQKLWGISPEEMIGKTPFDLMPPADREKAMEYFGRVACAPGSFAGLVTSAFIPNQNRRVFIETSGAPIFDTEGGILGFRGISRDITERKQAEEALKQQARELELANRQLEAFSYSVSHDLRNPLNTIRLLSAMLLKDYGDRLDENGRTCLRQVDEHVGKMGQLVTDMLNLAQSGWQEMKRESFDLSAMVRDFLQELITLEPDRQVDFVIEENVSVHADARLIRIAMVNLLRNAWKFTAKGEKALIEFGTDHENGEKVFFIRDNGVGFDMRFAEKIFEPFQRVHSDREFKGTGVGLSIVWRVVNRHGGRVWAMSEPEKGAVFYFTLGDK